ncbi:MAG: pyrroline-5-carboxylate reductase [Pyrinomonadaceae bacterium]|nr:pyrroline-5-carboxylate reductase [Pyrinomonadaceae bacterium]
MDQIQDDLKGKTDALQGTRLSFIGCGAMAEAIIAGLLKKNLVKTEQVVGSHPRKDRREELQKKYWIRIFESNKDAVAFGHEPAGVNEGDKSSSIVILTVKPQRLGTILRELKEAVQVDQLVISIVAGARIETIADDLQHGSIVRAMPNTPAQIGQGMTVWTATSEVTEAQQRQIQMIFGALGRELQVEEEKMIDMATALSATGPTYTFLVMEALIDAGVHMGFSRHVAEELVLQTMLGSVLFARESQKHPAELRNMVTSPGGTSAEAIYQMEKGTLRTVLSKAVWAAYQRAESLGRKAKHDSS